MVAGGMFCLFQAVNPFCDVAQHLWCDGFLNVVVFCRQSGLAVLEQMIE